MLGRKRSFYTYLFFIFGLALSLGSTRTVSRGDGAKMESSLWRKDTIGNPLTLDPKVQGFAMEWWTVLLVSFGVDGSSFNLGNSVVCS